MKRCLILHICNAESNHLLILIECFCTIFSITVFKAFDKKSCGTLRQEDYVIGIAKFLNGTVDEQVQSECRATNYVLVTSKISH